MDLLDYKPTEWGKAFSKEKDNLLFLLPQYRFNVEHIGATAVNSCRSFRNVDILISVHNFSDIYTLAMILNSSEYKEIRELSSLDCVVLVKRTKVEGVGITLRIVEYASDIYNRFCAFMILLRESYDRVQKYNNFRETLIQQYPNDIKKYNEAKIDYINSIIDSKFKFKK